MAGGQFQLVYNVLSFYLEPVMANGQLQLAYNVRSFIPASLGASTLFHECTRHTSISSTRFEALLAVIGRSGPQRWYPSSALFTRC